MTPDEGAGIPGWFIALAIIIVLLGVAGTVWRIALTRRVARDAGLDPNTAAAVSFLGNDGVGTAVLASTLASRTAASTTRPSPTPKTAEERLRELADLKDKGLVSEAEYETQRRQILDSI